MIADLDVAPVAVAPVDLPEPAPRWRLATRVAFRLSVVYFTLYVFFTQMLSGLLLQPWFNLPQFGLIAPMRPLVSWVASRVFHVTQPLVITGSGSGDKTYDWVETFCLLVIALAATAVWSLLDRRRGDYVRAQKWFRLFLRFALGSTMLTYAMVKVIPLQMPAPGLLRLIEPFGNFSPMGVLWYSIGASRPYEILVGCAELTAALLLFLPRTTTLGAIVCLFDTLQIFSLNMTYDVPVKLFAFHLVVMSLVLLAPEMPRLSGVLLFNRPVGPSTQPPLLRSRRNNRIALAVQAVFGLYLLGMHVYSSTQSWKQFGGGAPTSALYGIWNVDEMAIDGQTRAPLLTDHDRWRRLVFQTPTAAAFQRMDESLTGFGAAIDVAGHTLTLTKPSDKNWRAVLAYQQAAPDRLVLDGDMDGHRIHLQAQLFDRNKFLLVSRGFNWIQEYPFNR